MCFGRQWPSLHFFSSQVQCCWEVRGLFLFCCFPIALRYTCTLLAFLQSFLKLLFCEVLEKMLGMYDCYLCMKLGFSWARLHSNWGHIYGGDFKVPTPPPASMSPTWGSLPPHLLLTATHCCWEGDGRGQQQRQAYPFKFHICSILPLPSVLSLSATRGCKYDFFTLYFIINYNEK